jgi:hypothetical protein
MDEEKLRAIARDKLRSGALPRTRLARLGSGPGQNSLCHLCARRIPPEEMQLDLAEPQARTRLRDRYVFHARCHAVYVFERAIP